MQSTRTVSNWALSGLCVGIFINVLSAQTLLQADGPGETYELISSVLAPGYNPIETPDCSHPDFGKHIEEVWDSTLGSYVFLFHLHTAHDDDRCIKFDRQRNEIKTYNKSPATLKGTRGETVIYSWKFRLDEGFQPSGSFTHLHQLKAVGGSEASMPQITLTARLGNPERLELRYAETTSQTTIAQMELGPLKGVWVEAKEIVTYGEMGAYSLTLRTVKDSTALFTYQNPQIRMWKTDAEFIRPKWGIYRSLNRVEELRDETVRFSDIAIEEVVLTSLENEAVQNHKYRTYPNPFSDHLFIHFPDHSRIPQQGYIADGYGHILHKWSEVNGEEFGIRTRHWPAGLYFIVVGDGDSVSSKRMLKMDKGR